MAKYIQFDVANGLTAATRLTEGPFLIPADDILFATQASTATQLTLTITMSGRGAANYTWAVQLSTQTNPPAAPIAANVPVVTQGRPYVDSLYYAMTANPGGVKARYAPALDQNTVVAVNSGLPQRVYVNAIA